MSDDNLSVGDNVDEFNDGEIDDDTHGWVVDLVEDNTDDLWRLWDCVTIASLSFLTCARGVNFMLSVPPQTEDEGEGFELHTLLTVAALIYLTTTC